MIEIYPEEMPDVSLISAATVDILAKQFSSNLEHGQLNLPNGTNAQLTRHAEKFRQMSFDAEADGQLTFSHLLLATAYAALASEEDQAFRSHLVNLGSLTINAIEAIDRRAAA